MAGDADEEGDASSGFVRLTPSLERQRCYVGGPLLNITILESEDQQ